MTESLATLARWLDGARRGYALTGAGVSTESGIPDFRSDAGLWRDADPERVASLAGFLRDPAGFFEFWSDKFATLLDAEPNAAHRVLADLETRGRFAGVVTQNIDGLHQKAGSRNVHEVHGTFRRASCLGCGKSYDIGAVFEQVRGRGQDRTIRNGVNAPRCEVCEELIKPDVVLFGEMLPPTFERAATEIQKADLLLVLGSSLEVYPVADLVPRAHAAGARVALVNRDPGPYDERADLVVYGELGDLMPRLAAHLLI